MKINTLLLDRDGTLIEERHYLSHPDGVALLPGAEFLAAWKKSGGKAFLVSNQSGIGRGYFGEKDLHACNQRLQELLQEKNAGLDATRHCPHGPEDNCACRKPGTAMWESLQKEFALKPEHCAMIGDKPEDLGLAVNAGLAAAFLVLTGHGTKSAKKLNVSLAQGTDLAAIPIEKLPEQLRGTTRIYLATGLQHALEHIQQLH